MDRLTFRSIVNCVKEIDALEKLVLSGTLSHTEIADCLQEVGWNLTNVTGRRRSEYRSDEFQHRLRKLIKDTKRAKIKQPVEDTPEEDSGDWGDDEA